MTDFGAPFQCKCVGVMNAKGPLGPHEITRRGKTENDVVISIKYAGICHSDIHQVHEEWGSAIFPMVPGHEIGGHIIDVGSNVSKFSIGDQVGVGCMVESCRTCRMCSKGDQQYCDNGCVWTYNDRQKYPHCAEYNETGGAPTYGGYSKFIVVNQDFVLNIPSNLDLASATPLLCAGVTTFSPLIHFNLQPHHKFAVNGLGGLGHMGVKFGVAFGCHTSVISRGTSKMEDALNVFKAHNFIDSTSKEDMTANAGKLDFILNTVSAKHDIAALLNLLKVDGTLCFVGAPPEALDLYAGQIFLKRRRICGSLIGGIQETQEMLDFCGRHNITCLIEMTSAQKVNEAYERTVKSDVKYRFVIDCDTI